MIEMIGVRFFAGCGEAGAKVLIRPIRRIVDSFQIPHGG
jgi:hypothetical protein